MTLSKIQALLLAASCLLVFACQNEKPQVIGNRSAVKKAAASNEFNINAPAEAPVGQEVTFSWATIEDAEYYDLIIAQDPECTAHILQFNQLVVSSQIMTFVQPGDYYLCVTGTLKDGEKVSAQNNGIKIVIKDADADAPTPTPVAAEPTATPTVTPTPTNTPVNAAPTFNFNEPAGNNDSVTLSGSFNITWTDDDVDNNAVIKLYLKSANSGACNLGTLIDTINEDDAADTYAYSPTAVAVGNYYICANIDDSVNTAVEVFSGQLTVAYTNPNLAISGDAHAYAKQSVLWSVIMATGTGGTAPLTYSLPTKPAGATINSSTAAIDYTPAATGDDSFTVRVTDAEGQTADYSFTLHTNSYATCVWTGASSTTWSTAGNWKYCYGVAPTSSDRVAIASTPANQPTVTANTTISAFGAAAYSNGTVTVNAGITLTVAHTTEAVSSSVKVKGDTTTCSTCTVAQTGNDTYVINDAVLTLQSGITWTAVDLKIGNGITAGHFVTAGGATQAEWPLFYTFYLNQIKVQGAAGDLSSVTIDGLRIRGMATTGGQNVIDFVNHYDILQMDRITFSNYFDYLVYYVTYHRWSYIGLANCNNAAVSDNTWSGIDFGLGEYPGTYNVNAGSCSGIGPIAMQNPTGGNWGSLFENDPNNIITWSNDTSFTCTWTGNTSAAWDNSGNWSNCSNGRNGYPDHLDYVIIPSTATQPVINAKTYTRGFSGGAGGGILTINSGNVLHVSSSTQNFSSSVQLQGGTATCSDCFVSTTGNANINSSAALTFGNGLTFAVNYSSKILVGNGTTSGQFKTVAVHANSAAWPLITSNDLYFHGIYVNGASGNHSKIELDGLRMVNLLHTGTSYSGIELSDYYTVDKLDNVSIDSAGVAFSPVDSVGIKLNSCANATFNDTTWSGIDFVRTINTGYNVDASAANCSAISPIYLSGSGNGYGEQYDNDANNRIFFTLDLASAPTYPEGKVGSQWSQSFAGSGGTGPYTYSIPTNPGGAGIDVNGVFTYTPAGAGQQTYTVRVTDANGNIEDVTFILDNQTYYVCRWTAGVSSTWSTAGNWTTCGGVAPTSTDRVLVASGGTQPTVTANTTIEAFAAGTGGGTVTVNAGVTLTLSHATQTIASSITFQGDSTGCTTCIIARPGGIFTSKIINNATVTLGTGIRVNIYSLYVGDGSTAGHLATLAASGNSAEWPIVDFAGYGQLFVQGSSSVKSSLNLDGIKLENGYRNDYFVYLQDYYRIINFDSVVIDRQGDFPGSSQNIWLNNCANSTFDDVSWSNIEFKDARIQGVYTSCSGIGPITISGSGPGFGATQEVDPNNVINWTNGASFTCVWNGSASTSWTNPSNWTNCTNGRSNYPDQNDIVEIPSGGTQPTVSSRQLAYKIGGTQGGGTITIASGAFLDLMEPSATVIQNVTFQGSTTTCTDCMVRTANGILVNAGATLTLGSGLRMESPYVTLGNGVTVGHLVTNIGANSNEWPLLTIDTYAWSGIQVRGAGAGAKSSISINGLKIHLTNTNVNDIRLRNYSRVIQLDNVEINSMGTDTKAYPAILFEDCVGVTLDDTSWTGFTFVDGFAAGGYNVQASAAGCSSLTPFSLTGSGNGYGETLDDDPNDVVTWN